MVNMHGELHSRKVRRVFRFRFHSDCFDLTVAVNKLELLTFTFPALLYCHLSSLSGYRNGLSRGIPSGQPPCLLDSVATLNSPRICHAPWTFRHLPRHWGVYVSHHKQFVDPCYFGNNPTGQLIAGYSTATSSFEPQFLLLPLLPFTTCAEATS